MIRDNIDQSSLTWRAIKGWAEAEIARLHEEIERPGLPPTTTEGIRGAIGKLRELIQLPVRPAAATVEAVDYGLASED